jgi:DNA modification methylase
MIELNHIYNEDFRITTKRMPDTFLDSIVTDPPYEIGFMGKNWDGSAIAYDVEGWRECLRVLKPGGYLLAFGGTRTQHRMVCAIEDAGFEIRDTILWLYGSGFPKSLDISKQLDKEAGAKRTVRTGVKQGHEDFANRGNLSSVQSLKGTLGGEGGFARPWMDDPEQVEKYHSTFAPVTNEAKQWEGYGTALKPACEMITMARKPLSEKTVAQNVLKWGTGGINIDASRIECNDGVPKFTHRKEDSVNCYANGKNGSNRTGEIDNKTGRFPANVILSDDEEVLNGFPENKGAFAPVKSGKSGKSNGIYGDYATRGDDGETFHNDGLGSAARFFYIAKADQVERNDGLYQFEAKRVNYMAKSNGTGEPSMDGFSSMKNNFHPTVKPLKLIQYLQRMVTPKGGITYDPFGGSGTSAMAASNEGFKWIMSELIEEHCDIASKRIYNNNGLFA